MNLNADVKSTYGKDYCQPAAPQTPFLRCKKAPCTTTYTQPSPNLACSVPLPLPKCDVDSLYAANFTGVNETLITNSLVSTYLPTYLLVDIHTCTDRIYIVSCSLHSSSRYRSTYLPTLGTQCRVA